VNDVKQIIFPMTEITRRYKIRRQKAARIATSVLP